MLWIDHYVYAESLFKTLKYRPNYQPKGFEDLDATRKWCKLFVKWYRHEHHHSGIKFVTPAQMHNGEAETILTKRHELYEAAKALHPERWNNRNTRNWSFPENASLNPIRDTLRGGIKNIKNTDNYVDNQR